MPQAGSHESSAWQCLIRGGTVLSRCRQAVFRRLPGHDIEVEMIDGIRDFFRRHMDSGEPGRTGHSRQSLQVAAAALLIEVGRADFDMSDDELSRIGSALRKLFGLDPAQTDELISLARAEVESATSFHGFTSLINEHFEQPERVQLLELMWQIAYADDELEKHERHLMRKIAGLLHVSDQDYAASKVRAQKNAGREDENR